MLGRKQSIRADIMAPDYVQEESLNENAEIDWVNKVKIRWRSFGRTFVSELQSFVS